MKVAVSPRRRRLPVQNPAAALHPGRNAGRAIFGLLGLLLFVFASLRPSLGAAPGPINVITIDGVIARPVAGYLQRAVADAEEQKATALIIEMDTPGGELGATHDMVRTMLNAHVPVVVYISPKGASAGSAGTFITAAAHVAAMAPGTTIGAAHPVDESGKYSTEKVANYAASEIRAAAKERGRNVEWYEGAVLKSLSITDQEAIAKNVVDLLATSRADLIQKLNGRKVAGHVLNTTGAPVREVPMDSRERLLHTIAHPNVLFILITLAIYGLIAELQNPGLILPGIVGFVSLLLALYSMSVLPISALGLALILFGVVLMIVDLNVPSHGILTATGALVFALGAFMLVRSPDPFLRVSTRLIAVTTVTTALFFAFVVGAGLRAQRLRVSTGIEGLLGQSVLVKADVAPAGTVLAEGELWKAESVEEEGPIVAGERAVVVGVDGFTLKVRKEI